jgi:hypothetical protein
MPHTVIDSVDPDGRKVVKVPLNNRARPHQYATLDQTDFERITAAFGEAAWVLNGNGKGRFYVRLSDPERRNNTMIARIIMEDPEGRRVRHRDGDQLNLRRSNLEVVKPARHLSGRPRRWHLHKI